MPFFRNFDCCHPTKRLFGVLLTLLALLRLASADLVEFDPVLKCDDYNDGYSNQNNNNNNTHSNGGNARHPQRCAYRRFTYPYPSRDCYSSNPEVRRQYCRMRGNNRRTFLFVDPPKQQHDAAAAAENAFHFEQFYSGLMTQVSWKHEEQQQQKEEQQIVKSDQHATSCRASVNTEYADQTFCSSCEICPQSSQEKGSAELLFTIDCTNVPNGRRLLCESIEPFYYPFAVDSVDSSSSSSRVTGEMVEDDTTAKNEEQQEQFQLQQRSQQEDHKYLRGLGQVSSRSSFGSTSNMQT